ncbi:hypothetical protein CC1G_03795 [Coprinopsis cinerea okayama7|uniref:High-temperature-induced dauer-formation protein n=1 Tax=Coprinopsis cinerea (strain Okayama-7 / 130 / ATCC MYA-4618 / FGSC 9003) TaxID=240176 RepID=A8NGR3_COPC7|nr:hypothetical protein CC1G_03795 [Coprinopsis cinerea okayama7\|eukprot:XP_001833578.2 hypothetical protein CC1G_03795 [Coprinopsis cinerea okayama7\
MHGRDSRRTKLNMRNRGERSPSNLHAPDGDHPWLCLRVILPFNILGDETKLAFPSQPGGLPKLWNTRNISASDSYWQQYYILFDSASDVFSLITPHQIRRALLEAPENVATLIKVLCLRLFELQTDHTFPTPPPTSASATVAAFTSIIKSSSSDRNPTKEALNCIRILQRVLPVIFDVQGESSAFEREVLWKSEEVDDVPPPVSSDPQFVIEDEDESDDESESGEPKALKTPTTPRKKRLPSLGERLLNALIDLMYTCNLTLSPRVQQDHHKVQYIIWERGIGSTSDLASSPHYDSHKTEVLRLLLVLFSRQIYLPPSLVLSTPSLYTSHFVQIIPRRDVLTILCSLLNTAMNSGNPHEGATGIASLGAMAGKLPYNHLVFKGEDPRVVLTGMCLQVLCVLLDYQSGTARDMVLGEGREPVPTAKTNAFRYFLMKLHRTQDFDFVLTGINGILLQVMNSMNKLLPGARKPVPYIPETIILLWKFIELNKKFRDYLLESDKSTDLICSLLIYCIEIKDKPQQHGLCRAISYILQTLSAEPGWGSKLSAMVHQKSNIPTNWMGVSTFGDFLVHAIHAITSTPPSPPNAAPANAPSPLALFPALIITLANSAVSFKKLSSTSSQKMLQLFNAFANPAFLLADEGHPRLLFFMLEAFNSVILHPNSLSTNPTLIYEILNSHKTFKSLGTFTLLSGLREIRQREIAKEEMAKRAAAANSNPASRTSLSSEGDEKRGGKGKAKAEMNEPADPVGEKAMLLQNESWNAGARLEEASSSPRIASPPPPSNIPSSRSSEDNIYDPASSPLSEKARGKLRMREERSVGGVDSSLDLGRMGLGVVDVDVNQMVLRVGRNGFVPTQDWVTSWQQGLPLDPALLLISELLPKIQNIQATHKGNANSLNFIYDFIAHASLREVLPPPPPAGSGIRRFNFTDTAQIWLTSLLWGEIYVRGMAPPLSIWNNTNVRLFYVKHSAQNSHGGLPVIGNIGQLSTGVEAARNVVGGLLGRTSRSVSGGQQ